MLQKVQQQNNVVVILISYDMKTSQIQHFLAVLMYNLFYVQQSLAGTKQCCTEDVYVNCNNQPLYNITNKLPLHGVSW